MNNMRNMRNMTCECEHVHDVLAGGRPGGPRSDFLMPPSHAAQTTTTSFKGPQPCMDDPWRAACLYNLTSLRTMSQARRSSERLPHAAQMTATSFKAPQPRMDDPGRAACLYSFISSCTTCNQRTLGPVLSRSGSRFGKPSEPDPKSGSRFGKICPEPDRTGLRQHYV